MKKKFVRWISIQQLIIYDVMLLNDLCSIDHKQNHNVTTCLNNEMNHKIWFLSFCHSNIDFFWYWYEDSQIHDRYFDWSLYNTQAVIGQVNIECQTLTDAMADRGRGVHPAADRDCKDPARVPGGENADFIPRRIRVQLHGKAQHNLLWSRHSKVSSVSQLSLS